MPSTWEAEMWTLRSYNPTLWRWQKGHNEQNSSNRLKKSTFLLWSEIIPGLVFQKPEWYTLLRDINCVWVGTTLNIVFSNPICLYGDILIHSREIGLHSARENAYITLFTHPSCITSWYLLASRSLSSASLLQWLNCSSFLCRLIARTLFADYLPSLHATNKLYQYTCDIHSNLNLSLAFILVSWGC